MKKYLRRGGLAVSLISMIAGGALAQSAPPSLSDVAGLAYEGQIGGLEVWSAPNSPELYAVTPDGRTLVRGSIFSGSGRDLGSVLTGSEPADLIPGAAPAPAAESAAGLGDETDLSAPTKNDLTAPPSFADLLGPDSCQSPVLADTTPTLSPGVAGWDADGRGNPPTALDVPDQEQRGLPVVATDETGLMDGSEIAREAQNALGGFDEDQRRDLLLGLVEDLERATSTEEFLSALADWRAGVDTLRVERGLPRLYSEDGAAPLPPVASATPATPAIPFSKPPAVTVTDLPPAPSVTDETGSELTSVTATDSAVGQEASSEISLEQALLEDARHNALWFSVGANDAPSVYAFIDPTCSYSARAISSLSDKVGAGEVQLRVILAPVLSQRSAGLVAGILTDDRPPLAFFDHEVDLAERGQSDLVPSEFSELPAPVQAGIQRNFEMIRDYGIPGVPFFVYETAEGARVLSGAPGGIAFPGALNDPYTGIK